MILFGNVSLTLGGKSGKSLRNYLTEIGYNKSILSPTKGTFYILDVDLLSWIESLLFIMYVI